MGMDNYLYKRTYIDSDYYSDEKNKFIQPECCLKYLNNNNKLKEQFKDKIFHPTYIVEEICYWRKAYQFHKYIVEEYGNGVDDMRPIYLKYNDLKEIYLKCKKIYDTSIEDGIDYNDKNLYYEDMSDKNWVKVAQKEIQLPYSNILISYDSTYLYQIKSFIDCFEKLHDDNCVEFYYEASY